MDLPLYYCLIIAEWWKNSRECVNCHWVYALPAHEQCGSIWVPETTGVCFRVLLLNLRKFDWNIYKEFTTLMNCYTRRIIQVGRNLRRSSCLAFCSNQGHVCYFKVWYWFTFRKIFFQLLGWKHIRNKYLQSHSTMWLFWCRNNYVWFS